MIKIRATQICSGCGQRKEIGEFAISKDGSHITRFCEKCAL